VRSLEGRKGSRLERKRASDKNSGKSVP
jgi:hypothetical protein